MSNENNEELKILEKLGKIQGEIDQMSKQGKNSLYF